MTLERAKEIVGQMNQLEMELDQVMLPIYSDFTWRFLNLPIDGFKEAFRLFSIELGTWPSCVYKSEARTIMIRRYREVVGNYPKE